MRFQIPNIIKFYVGVRDTNTNSTKYTLETSNNPKYKFFGYLAHQIVMPWQELTHLYWQILTQNIIPTETV